VGARYEEEVRGWDGVMQSYYVDQWEPQRLLLEATFTPLAFGGGWLQGTGRQHQQAMLDFGHIGSIGVHLSDESQGRIRLTNNGSLRASYKLTAADADRLTYGIARAAEIHFAAGATEVYPNIARAGVLTPKRLADFESTRFRPSELRLEAFHPMGTARIASENEGVCAPDGSVRGTRDLYIADASLFPTSVGVNPMMTVIAFARQIAEQLAQQRAE
jgi:choline dehydrogenase-like flavoprotein